MPSIAPPTDEIDSEWGADEIPAPAPLPKLAAAGASPSTPAPRASSTPAPRASTPAPRPSASPAAHIPTPIPRPSRPSAVATPLVTPSTRPSAIATPLVPASTPPSAVATPLAVPAASATATPLINPTNPLRKQTLLGMAPVIPPRASEPPAVAAPAVAAPAVAAPAAETPAPVPGTPLVATPSANPLRKQTLLGIAPVLAREPQATTPEPVVEPAPSVSSIVTPAAVATDAPTTSDVPATPVAEPKPRRAEPLPAAALSSSHDDLPELQPRRPRWVLPLGVAAALALGVVGLRQLDHAPAPVPAELAKPVNAAKAPIAAPKPKSDDGDDGDLEPSTGSDPAPGPIPTEPDPLGAKGSAGDTKAAPAPSAATADAAAPSASAAPSAAATAGTIRINVDSDPPGARLFWKGKEQGTTPFVLEFQAGERHAYELGLPGYTTRKVVIDGSKTDITIGLRPDPTAPSGGTARK